MKGFMLEFTSEKIQETQKENGQEQEDLCGLYYTMESLYYGCPQTHGGEPHICLKLTEIGFPKNNSSHIYFLDDKCVHHGDKIFLCLNAKTFSNLTGYWWNETKEGLEPLKEILAGKKFKINLGM